MAKSVKRVGSDAERLTRRNMKICVTEHVQTLCLDDPAFARLTMHPRKNMVNCFRYINRKAREFMEAEMKDNDEKPAGWQGGDVPDDMCYRWAEEYFRDADAEEDRDKEEQFVPKTYYGGYSSSKKQKKEAKPPKPKPEKVPKPADSQVTLFGSEASV
jgi:hypothetical protein